MMKTASGKEYVVEGAIVTCNKGSLPTKLKATKNTRIGMNLAMVETDTAPSCFAGTFGICAKNKKPCVMKTLPKWMITATGFLIDGGIPVVTMESFLVCTMGARVILPVSSGQMGGEIAWMLALMDLKYPGLRAILEDPNGSLYLNEGMHELALQFLADKIEERNGSIFLFGLDTQNDLMDAYIQSAISRLVASVDVSEPGRFLNGLEDMITRAGVKNGVNARNLDAKMMEVLRKDCADYAEKVAQDGYFRWQEENRVFLSALADMTGGLAYAAMLYASTYKPQKPSQNRDLRDAEIAKANRETGARKGVRQTESWYNADGSFNYPPNNGAVPGTEKTISLRPGDSFGRYGNIGDKSNFATQPGADANKLSLPPTTNPGIYQEFVVVKKISEITQAEIAQWGDSDGGGLQYELPMPIKELIIKGYIIPK